MSNVKYEPIFGDQSLFDGGPEDAEIAAKFDGGIAFFPKQKPSSKVFFVSGVELAMRRIIAEPNRWTVEDKKAGKLPEVGCKCRTGKNEEIVRAVTKVFIVTEDDDGSVSTTRIDRFLRTYQPIETPEERSQRLEDEWVNKAWGETAVFAGVTQDEHDRLRIHLKHIYRAQLSGELQAPDAK